MISLFIGSTGEYSGKSLLCIGLGRQFQKDGLKVAYFKPLGTLPKWVDDVLTDDDALTVQQALGLSEPLHLVCPVVLTQDLVMKGYRGEAGRLRQDILNAHEELSRGKDIVLVGGAANLHAGAFLGITAFKLAQQLQAKVIIVDKGLREVSLDYLFWARETLGDLMLGTILNQVPYAAMDFVRRNLVPFLESNGIRVFGVVPCDAVLSSATVADIQRALGGKVLCCEEKLNELVEDFMIGAMTLEKALDFFRRTRNKAVVVGGDRSDILLAALQTSTRCLIVTGNLQPEREIMNRAAELGVPIILVEGDTFSTVERLGKVLGRLELKDERKVQRGTELVEKELDFKRLYEALGLKRG